MRHDSGRTTKYGNFLFFSGWIGELNTATAVELEDDEGVIKPLSAV